MMRTSRTLKFMRWFGFLLALGSVIVLTTFKVHYLQSFGWTLSVMACAIWSYDSYKLNATPRMLMELMYLFFGIWGIINWL